MVKPLNILLQCIVWLILPAIAVSCTSDSNLLDDGADGGTATKSAITFSFNIYTEDTPTDLRLKSRTLGVWEEDAANVAERILNADDMRILFFDQSGNFLISVAPTRLDYHGNEITNNGYYTLSAVFKHDYFDNFDDTANVPFQVMILANLGGTGTNYIEYTPNVSKVADIKEFFILSPDYYPTENIGIPMYGIQSFYVPKMQLMQGIEDAPITGEIDLIRSLCKIEVSDNIINSEPYPDGNSYPKVTAVEMISWNNHGYIRPKHDNYADGLTESNIYPALHTEAVVNAKEVADDKFRFYCPEADVGDMKFRVTAVMSPGAEPQTFEIGLDDFSSEIGVKLVRNHIYRFNVRAVNTVADLTVEVSDWNVETSEFELNDIVSVEPDGFLKWQYDPANFAVSTETYNGNLEQQLSILNGTQSYATGTFHLISPKGAKWKAYFIPGENGVDAFEFVDIDADGNVVEGSQNVYVEGEVGEVATIHIRGKGTADSYHHWAELVVEVENVDGNTLFAPLTSAMSSRYIIYRESRL